MKLNEAKSQLNNYIKNPNVKKQIILTPHSKRMTIYPIVTSCDIYHHFVVKKYTHNENVSLYFHIYIFYDYNLFPLYIFCDYIFVPIVYHHFHQFGIPPIFFFPIFKRISMI